MFDIKHKESLNEIFVYNEKTHNSKVIWISEFFYFFKNFKKKFKFLGSHVVVLVKTFPLMYQLLM